jgi:predicted nucleic acid-binding protein
VLGEALTFLAYHDWRRQAVELHSMIQAAMSTNLLIMEWVTPRIHDDAWAIFQRYDDQTFSYCDCTSIAICVSRNVDFVFGFDRHFEVAGLDLRPRP